MTIFRIKIPDEDFNREFFIPGQELRSHTAFFCRHCGEIWARLTNEDQLLDEWRCEVRSCSKCSTYAKDRWWELPGSIIVHAEDIAEFPPELIRRELILTRRKLCFCTD
jgi:hypothetical protein